MYYILYIDRLFFLNLCMDFFALSLMNLSLRRTATRRRIFCSALAGAAGYIAVLFLPAAPYLLKTIGGFSVISLIMILIMYPKSSFSFFIKALTSLYAFAFLLGGVLLFLKKYKSPFPDNFFFSVLFPSAFIYVLIRFFLKKRREGEKECEVVLLLEEREVKVKAFIDSGNMLKEPISKKPVSVIEAEVLKREGIMLPEEKCRVIPYHSVGKKNGILMGYEIPGMIICMEDTNKNLEKIMIAVSEDNLFTNRKYGMILHPELLEEFG